MVKPRELCCSVVLTSRLAYMWPTTNNFGCSVKVNLLIKLLTLPCNVVNSEGDPTRSNYIDITGLLTDGGFGHASHLKGINNSVS